MTPRQHQYAQLDPNDPWIEEGLQRLLQALYGHQRDHTIRTRTRRMHTLYGRRRR